MSISLRNRTLVSGRPAKLIMFASMLIVFAAAVLAADWISSKAPVVDSASLGIAFVYLVYRAYLAPSRTALKGQGWVLDLSQAPKLLAWTFVLALNASWAGDKIGDLLCWIRGCILRTP